MGFFDKLFGKKPGDGKPSGIGLSEKSATPQVTNHLAELSAKVPFQLRVFQGQVVEEIITRFRSSYDDEGIPVAVGDFEHASRLVQLWDQPYDFDKELERANALYPEKWFEERKNEDSELYAEEDQSEIHANGTAPMTKLTVGYDFKNNPHPEVFVALIPTKDSTTIPLHLRFGGWNDCPSPHVHTALARYWRDRYGAEIATLTSDVMEFTVERPPRSDADALELAWQQCLYCSDIVYQGAGSVATLARSLRNSTRWYFWWD
jgi:hypothetical protein